MKNMVKIISLCVLISFIISCNNSAPYPKYTGAPYKYNGLYDSQVTYFNPRTKTSSVYTLQVSVDHDTLNTIYFDDNKWIDQDDFGHSRIFDEKGAVSAELDNGVLYQVFLYEDEEYDGD